MSDVLIEHPVLVIEELLKLGIGDEGRLLYLRKAVTKGSIIHKSDKKFLKKMQFELDEIKSSKSDKLHDFSKPHTLIDKTFSISDEIYKNFKQEKNYKKNKQTPEDDSGILKIQDLIGELKTSQSKLMDNLELLLLSREASSQPPMDSSVNSFSNSLKNHNADLFEMIKNNPISEKKFFVIKKHQIMTVASAGLFALWFASYQNMIDIGPLQNLPLGLSASSIIAAGIFYKKQKSSKIKN